MQKASLALLALATATQADLQSNHGHANNNYESARHVGANYKRFDEQDEVKRTTLRFSHCMSCMDGLTAPKNGNCFIDGVGGFARGNYEAKFSAAVAGLEKALWKTSMPVAQGYKKEDDVEYAGFQGVQWDRVWEKTNPAEVSDVHMVVNQTQTEADDEGVLLAGTDYKYSETPVPDPTFWNVCIRVSVKGFPEFLVEHMPEILDDVENEYNVAASAPVKVHGATAWIENVTPFLTNQLEPVKGLGHKDQRFLLPLLLGVFCMLFVPTMLSWGACTWAQGQKKFEDIHGLQEKVIKYMEDSIAAKTASADQRGANVQRYEKIASDEQEMRRVHLAREFADPDMDWTKEEEEQ